PVPNPLAPDTCLVKAGDSYPKNPANCVRIQPTYPPPPPQPPPALIAAEDMSYYPTVGDGGRFPLHCKDETGDCSVSEAQQRRCGNIDKIIGNGTKILNGDADPDCTATVLDHYTTSFNWAPNNFGAILLRPQWYLVTNSVITDVQNGGLSFVTGGDYTKSSIINGYWSLTEHSILVGNTQGHPEWTPPDPLNPFAENDGPFNPNGGPKCE